MVAIGQYLGEGSSNTYDYAEIGVPVLRAMHTRRLATSKQLGFRENGQAATSPQLTVPIRRSAANALPLATASHR